MLLTREVLDVVNQGGAGVVNQGGADVVNQGGAGCC